MATPGGQALEGGPGGLDRARERMVREQIAARGVRDPRVLEAMLAVPRHRFVPGGLIGEAYADCPLPIGRGQTISQPYIVAVMAEALELAGHERVLEVGSGSGYMAAVLARLAGSVCAVELEPELNDRAARLLALLGCAQVELRCGDGALGWPERAPFAAIVVSCAAGRIPPALWSQLEPGGRMILPLGQADATQELVLARKTGAGPVFSRLMAVRFVPLRPG